MKTRASVTVALLLAAAMAGGGSPVRGADEAAPGTLVWCGLDYARVKMIGTEGFEDPAGIVPDKPAAWNSLFMQEMLPALEKLGVRLATDTKAVLAGNEKLTAACIVHEDGSRAETVDASHITEAQIAATVRGYTLKTTQGVGLVFIMDRLVKAQKTACFYVVFFDVGSRRILHQERMCEAAGGIGFRNFWFGPIKKAVKQLPALYRKVQGGQSPAP